MSKETAALYAEREELCERVRELEASRGLVRDTVIRRDSLIAKLYSKNRELEDRMDAIKAAIEQQQYGIALLLTHNK